jgi:phosphoribosylglycinamide formyltransferase 1
MVIMKKVIIFASGGGSNAKAIWQHSQRAESNFEVSAIFCNNKNAGVIPWCLEKKIPLVLFTNTDFLDEEFLQSVSIYDPALIVLAGFLRKVPLYLIRAYDNKIINIHPALLPKYGGQGMYGHHVHQAVKANQEIESGITIHYVNEHYDEGTFIAQYKTDLLPTDTAEDIAKKVLALEHQYYAREIEFLIS